MSISNPALPKSFLAFRVYSYQMFVRDLIAGVTVGLVALPLAMAFGIASPGRTWQGRLRSLPEFRDEMRRKEYRSASEIGRMKELYGTTLVCGFARIDGHVVR